jgi:hypothetical protein
MIAFFLLIILEMIKKPSGPTGLSVFDTPREENKELLIVPAIRVPF